MDKDVYVVVRELHDSYRIVAVVSSKVIAKRLCDDSNATSDTWSYNYEKVRMIQ